ncbi:MAG: DUF4124 domain-containing protein [Gammaproteobacteria bacterium]|nr:MAG: DUF4124 domain-containing protein [Gammaproteobacteria bacterium]
MRFGWSLLVFAAFLAAIWWSLTPVEQQRLMQAFGKPARTTGAASSVQAPVPDTRDYQREEYTPPSACVPREAVAEPEVVPGVYRWQDVNGRWHYSDKYPVGAARVEDLSAHFESDVRHVSIRMQGDVTGWAGSLQDQLTLDAEYMFRLYARYLPDAGRRRMTVTVNVFASREGFVAWRESRDQSSGANAGMYDTLGREVAVLLVGDREWDAGLIRHEIAHAIHHEVLARPPTWFDEGMAEVFNAVSFRDGQWRLAGAHEPHLKRLADAGQQDVVSELLRSDWPGADPLLSYARVWSMAAFFLSTQPEVFGRYVQWLDAHYCEQVDSQAFIAEQYPGGLARWQRDWEQWLDNQRDAVTANWWKALPMP